MTRHLLFTLAAPFGAFAVTPSAANAAMRPTRLDPPKSALTGLVGAALGCERHELGTLAEAVLVAVREGLRPKPDPKWDFHTITKAVRAPHGTWSRFEELRARMLRDRQKPAGSIISTREFWSVGLWTVSLVRTDAAGPSLERMQEALQRPHWPLHAGRKAYALGLPPDPAIVEAEGLQAAHDAYGWPWERHPSLAGLLGMRISQATLRFDAGYPGAPNGGFEVEETDVPFPGVTAQGRLVRGYAARWVRSVATTSGVAADA